MTDQQSSQRDWKVVPAHDGEDPLGDWQIYCRVENVEQFFGGFGPQAEMQDMADDLNALEAQLADALLLADVRTKQWHDTQLNYYELTKQLAELRVENKQLRASEAEAGLFIRRYKEQAEAEIAGLRAALEPAFVDVLRTFAEGPEVNTHGVDVSIKNVIRYWLQKHRAALAADQPKETSK